MRKNPIQKICKYCESRFETYEKRTVFCSKRCSAIHNNSNRNYPGHDYICSLCGIAFHANYSMKKNRLIHCKSCRDKIYNRTRPKRIKDLISIKQVSKKTISKIIKRMSLECSACGWCECIGDLHHIIHRKEGGTDEHTNLTYLCPNCHRKVHSGLAVSYKTFFEQVGDSWKAYYNIR